MKEYWLTFQKVCQECLHLLITIYKFITTCNTNATTLTQTLVSLKSSLDYTEDEDEDSKTMFISLNTEDFTTNHIYDEHKLDTTSAIFQRYKFLDTVITKAANQPNLQQEKRKTISDMLLDPTDKIPRCKECSKAYSSLHTLRIHFSKVHTLKDYVCPTCPKSFGSSEKLEYHISTEHNEFVCSVCGKSFSRAITFKQHELSHHLQFVCPDCGRVYKSRNTYRKHIKLNICNQVRRANPANAQYTCDHCGKKYTQKISLRVHIQYTHGNYKAHVCKWCGKKFWAQSRLKAHIVKHTKEKKFPCSICKGKFVTRESLLYHTRLHTGEKPYRCSLCNCTFISSSRRTYHMKTYHLHSMVECEGCYSKFASEAYLDKHKKLHKDCQKTLNTDLKVCKAFGNNVGKDLKTKLKMQRSDNISLGTIKMEPMIVLQPQPKKVKQHYSIKKRLVLEEAQTYVCDENGSYVLIETEFPDEFKES